MTNRHRRSGRLLVIVLALMTLVLAACAPRGGGGSGPTTTDAVTGSKTTKLPGKFPPNSTMATIQKRGLLVVGVVEGEAPFSSTDPNTGSWVGFDIEVAKQVAVAIFGSQIENKIRWIPLNARDRELALEQGRVDIAMGRYTITIPRKRFADFAGPYYISYQEAVVQSDSRGNVGGLVDLNGEAVCTVQGSTNMDAAKAALPGADLSEVKNTVQECAAALTAGEVSGVVADHVDLLPVTSGGARRISVLPTKFGQEPYGIGVKRGVLDFRQFLNDTLERDISQNYSNTYKRAVTADRSAVTQPPVDRY